MLVLTQIPIFHHVRIPMSYLRNQHHSIHLRFFSTTWYSLLLWPHNGDSQDSPSQLQQAWKSRSLPSTRDFVLRNWPFLPLLWHYLYCQKCKQSYLVCLCCFHQRFVHYAKVVVKPFHVLFLLPPGNDVWPQLVSSNILCYRQFLQKCLSASPQEGCCPVFSDSWYDLHTLQEVTLDASQKCFSWFEVQI